jgi:Domain of unknown function (DUF222)
MNSSLERLGEQVDVITTIHARLATDAAVQAVAIDEARLISETLPLDGSLDQKHVARRVLVTELACALRLPERTMETLIEVSKALVHVFPATLAALHDGLISYRNASILVDQATGLSPEDKTAFEAAVLPAAGTLTSAKFTQKARRIRERLDAESITARHQRSVADRAIFFEPASDGMAWLSQYLPAADAAAIYHRVTGIAMTLQGPAEPRTLTQLQADTFTDLVLDGSPGTDTPASAASQKQRGVKPDVCILVPALTLLGRSDEPAILEGYGPIDIDTAKRLVGKATSFIRILTHPETGAFLSVGRKRYKAPADLRTVLRLRDETCRHPGCNRAAGHTDIDHTIAFNENGAHGETRIDNLASLCPKNHRDKHETGWRVTQDPDGTLHWVSPTGHGYDTEPAIRIGPTSDAAPF